MKGLYDKYIIIKTDGEPVDPNAVYFVLRLDTDSFARRTILKYIDIQWYEGNRELAVDLQLLLQSLAKKKEEEKCQKSM